MCGLFCKLLPLISAAVTSVCQPIFFYPFPVNPQPNRDAKSAQRVFYGNGICGAHRQGLTCNSTNFNLELPKARGLPLVALVLRVGITAKTSGVRERNAWSREK